MSSLRPSHVMIVLLFSATYAFSGCAKSAREEKNADEFAVPTGSMTSSKTEAAPGERDGHVSQVGTAFHDVSADLPSAKAGKKPPAKAKAPIERKIIYTATIQVIVDDLDAARKKLDALRKTHKAYVANANISGQTGSQRSGSWTIRLPVGEFAAFRKAILDFGYPQQNALSSEDITRQYYSLESRMRNAEATEKRLLAHLEKSKETKDTLAIEKELDRVRESIEQMKGQLQVWQTLTALTTVNLTLIERKNYQPPQEPTFASRIGDTFSGSVDALVSFGRGVALFFVALAPWLPLLAVIVVPIWWTIRRSRRKSLHKEAL